MGNCHGGLLLCARIAADSGFLFSISTNENVSLVLFYWTRYTLGWRNNFTAWEIFHTNGIYIYLVFYYFGILLLRQFFNSGKIVNHQIILWTFQTNPKMILFVNFMVIDRSFGNLLTGWKKSSDRWLTRFTLHARTTIDLSCQRFWKINAWACKFQPFKWCFGCSYQFNLP